MVRDILSYGSPVIIDNKVQSILASQSLKITRPRSINSNYLLGGALSQTTLFRGDAAITGNY